VGKLDDSDEGEDGDSSNDENDDDVVSWCHVVLGARRIVEIKSFVVVVVDLEREIPEVEIEARGKSLKLKS
jgi:hypothetical protein